MQLIVNELCKAYHGKTVLDRLSFAASAGITRISGASGAGKTTLLRILMGLEDADSGTFAPENIRWSAVFQEDQLLLHLDAAGNLRFALGAAYDAKRASELLTTLGLADVDGKRARDYSGGMKRRLALARALLAPCDAIALDEPFTGMDAENRAAAAECILRAADTKIVLLTTHDAINLPCDQRIDL